MKSVKIKLTLVSCLYLTIYMSCFCFIKKPLIGIRVNQTSSIPYKYLLRIPFNTPKKYNYVALRHSSTPDLLVKQIVGIPGDRILHQKGHIFVNNLDCGEVLGMTSTGAQLSPIEMKEIPEGYVFVYAPHPQSFDSRYQQFGLVQTDQLQEVLWPIF
jgi:conjugal transfer pilin signal peptidase TrbI